jgi:hypothetical protein
MWKLSWQALPGHWHQNEPEQDASMHACIRIVKVLLQPWASHTLMLRGQSLSFQSLFMCHRHVKVPVQGLYQFKLYTLYL